MSKAERLKRRREQNAIWRRENPERAREADRKAQKKWRDKNRERYRKYMREYMRDWRKRNPTYARDWLDANPDKQVQYYVTQLEKRRKNAKSNKTKR